MPFILWASKCVSTCVHRHACRQCSIHTFRNLPSGQKQSCRRAKQHCAQGRQDDDELPTFGQSLSFYLKPLSRWGCCLIKIEVSLAAQVFVCRLNSRRRRSSSSSSTNSRAPSGHQHQHQHHAQQRRREPLRPRESSIEYVQTIVYTHV